MLNSMRPWVREAMPKFYSGTDGKAGFKFWTSGTGIHKIPVLKLLPYFDDRTIGIHFKFEFTKGTWKAGQLLLQSGNIKEFDENKAECIESFRIDPILKNVWEGDRIFKDGQPIQFPVGKYRIYLMLQKEIAEGNSHPEKTCAVQVAWLNIVDGGDWFFNKGTQLATALIAIAALIVSIIK